jgi:hypothetical protein
VRRGWLALALALPACGSPCFVADDATPGWKRVALPSSDPSINPPNNSADPLAAQPSLAAPDGVEQFRAGEPAIVWGAARPGPPPGHPSPGVVEYRFPIPDARVFECEFTAALDGALVDVDAETRFGAVPLVAARRVRDRVVRVEWDRDDVRTLVVTVHHHLRPLPIAARSRAGTIALVDEPAHAACGAALYYRQPTGRRVELCPAPGRRLEVARASLPSSAQPVTLERARGRRGALLR